MFAQSSEKIDINKALVDAIFKKDHEKIESLLSQENPADPNNEINAIPIILHAAQQKDWKMVEILYNYNADLDAKVGYANWHLIHECVKSAPEKVTKAIVEYCNINAQTKTGKTALMIALEENKLEIAEFLIDTGRMDLSLWDKENNNAAHYAAKNNQLEIFVKLALAGVPLNKPNDEEHSPLDLIQDVAFKENLPKILGDLAKVQKYKRAETTVEKSEDIAPEVKEEAKPKVSGLSSIKRK